MNKLTVDLQNCYGIKRLIYEFDFEDDKRAFAIYAPNGAMKSSLAQTFKDISAATPSVDRIFPSRVTSRKVTDEGGAEVPAEAIFVIEPYDEIFGHSEETSTLLIDSELKKEYERLHIEINKSKNSLLKALKKQAGKSRRDFAKEISSTFTARDDDFLVALGRVESEVANQSDVPFAEVPYDIVFDDKVLTFLAIGDSKIAIDEYVRRYNELLAASTFFKQGVFNYYNAATIAKNLAANGFFEAKHSVQLNAEAETQEITSQSQLEQLIAAEKEQIAEDQELRRKFAQIDVLLEKNAQLRAFRTYVEQHEEILPRLANIEQLREDILKSYLVAQYPLYLELMSKVRETEQRKKEIEKEAKKQVTQWEEVISIFNNRFFVPFTLVASNKVQVMLGEDPILSLEFVFKDGDAKASVGRDQLMRALSTGEKKALYVLNVIFEVEVRKKDARPTVFVVDDIADSFDYKNKYAIVQYLRDISEEPFFRQILLTHNFDFFRTVSSRFVGYARCLMASRDSQGIHLGPASGIRNIFVRDWKRHFFNDSRKKIASIPFIRNIVEYTRGTAEADYTRLTSLLHWKADSESILVADLDAIYNRTFLEDGSSDSPDKSVVSLVFEEAESCLEDTDGPNFENKIVLSIAIRLRAERYMIDRISDTHFVGSITAHQTSALFSEYRRRNGGSGALEVLERVVLMTPENLHLNSFMYEPIMDMSDEHLRKLYKDTLEIERSHHDDHGVLAAPDA